MIPIPGRPLRVRGVIVATGLAATCALPAVAAGTVAPHVSQQAVRSWQVLAPGWSKSDKEAGRVDDVYVDPFRQF